MNFSLSPKAVLEIMMKQREGSYDFKKELAKEDENENSQSKAHEIKLSKKNEQILKQISNCIQVFKLDEKGMRDLFGFKEGK